MDDQVSKHHQAELMIFITNPASCWHLLYFVLVFNMEKTQTKTKTALKIPHKQQKLANVHKSESPAEQRCQNIKMNSNSLLIHLFFNQQIKIFRYTVISAFMICYFNTYELSFALCLSALLLSMFLLHYIWIDWEHFYKQSMPLKKKNFKLFLMNNIAEEESITALV